MTPPVLSELRGPAFTASFKSLACVTVLGCAGWLAWLVLQGQIQVGESTASRLYFLGGLGILFYTLIHIFRSQTSFSATAIHQSWMWDKNARLSDLAYAKLIRIPGLEWLIAPRLYTRSMAGKLAVFYVAQPHMWPECTRLAKALETMRHPT